MRSRRGRQSQSAASTENGGMPFAPFPWPYTDHEIAEIKELLPDGNSATLVQIVGVAQCSVMIRRQLSSLTKPKLAKQLRRFGRALQIMDAAIKQMSVDTWMRLDDHNGPSFRKSVSNFVAAFSQVQHIKLDVSYRPGRNENDLAVFLSFLRTVYEGAYPGLKRRRGWPHFRNLCVAPLGFARISHESLDELLRTYRARRRNQNPDGLANRLETLQKYAPYPASAQRRKKRKRS